MIRRSSITERLEKRLCLSAFTITGTGGADTIEVTVAVDSVPGFVPPYQTGSHLYRVNSGAWQVISGTITSLIVNAQSGNDTIRAFPAAQPDGLNIYEFYPTLPMSINGGDGADTITGGWGADTLNGDAGNDTFLFPTSLYVRHIGADNFNGGANDSSGATRYFSKGGDILDFRDLHSGYRFKCYGGWFSE